jgi:hypothetical protein
LAVYAPDFSGAGEGVSLAGGMKLSSASSASQNKESISCSWIGKPSPSSELAESTIHVVSDRIHNLAIHDTPYCPSPDSEPSSV